MFELQQKLQKKYPDADAEMLQSVLAQLREENLQSDARFAESYVRYRKSRGFGYHHIRADLSRRRVAAELLESHLHPDDEDWQTIAADLVARRLGQEGSLQFGSRDHRRLLRLLESRGFGHREIQQTLEPYLSVRQSPGETALNDG